MLKAQGYTPTIIWVKAGADIEKHRAVILTSESVVLPAQTSGSTAIGFTLTTVVEDDYVAVQTDGIIYEWSGNPSSLAPATAYYQGDNGVLSDQKPTDDSDPLGFAVDESTFHIRIGGSGGIAASSVRFATYYLVVDAASVIAKAILLPSNVTKKDVEDVILYGGDIHLREGVDYVFDQADIDPGTTVTMDGNSDRDGIFDATVTADEVVSGTPGAGSSGIASSKLMLSWDPAKLDPSKVSILERLRSGDIITIKCAIQA